jgi:hypothetical protein
VGILRDDKERNKSVFKGGIVGASVLKSRS